MELTVDDVVATLKNISTRQEQIATLEDSLAEDVRKVDQQAKLLMGSATVSADDRNKLIEGLSNFVADTYKRTVARALRTQGRLALADDTEEAPRAELDLTGGGFPRMS